MGLIRAKCDLVSNVYAPIFGEEIQNGEINFQRRNQPKRKLRYCVHI